MKDNEKRKEQCPQRGITVDIVRLDSEGNWFSVDPSEVYGDEPVSESDLFFVTFSTSSESVEDSDPDTTGKAKAMIERVVSCCRDKGNLP